jgi:PKD domain
VAAVLAALSIGLVAPALAGAAWLPPVDLSPRSESLGLEQIPEVAVGSPGDAVAAWPWLHDEFTAQAASKLPGQGWAARVDLSPSDEEGIDAQVAINAAGQAVAVWVQRASQVTVQAKRRSPDGVWGPVEEVAGLGQDTGYLDVAIDPAGRATVAWSRLDQVGPSTYFVEAASGSPDGGWSPPVKLSAAGSSAWEPELSVDAAGHVVAVWVRYDESNDTIVQAAEKDAAGDWSEAEDLSEPGADSWFPVIDGAAGRTVVLWEREDVVEAAVREPGGSWRPSEEVSPPGSTEPAVAMDGTGRALAIWSTDTIGIRDAEVATLSHDGSWSLPLTISESLHGEAPDPEVAVTAGGRAVAVWDGWDGNRRLIEGASGDLDGNWEPALALSPPGRWARNGNVAIDDQGNAVAVWRAAEPWITQASILDVTAPELKAVSIPSSAGAGQPVSFAASPFDAWSTVAPLAWSFGDGTSASGSAVTHTFAQAAKYRITVTATDAAGNQTSTTQLLDVTSSPASPAFATSKRIVLVKRGRAQLELSCPGTATCQGSVLLKSKLSGRRRGRPRQIAKTAFSIPPATQRTVKAKLSRKAQKLLLASPNRTLKAQLTGEGVKARGILLKAVPQRHR